MAPVQNNNDPPEVEDPRRGEQLRCLQQCELPKNAKDKNGHGISGLALKSVLIAIDQFSRGRPGGAWASVPTLAKVANVGTRTATRAIEVLEAQGLLVVAPATQVNRLGHRGSPTNCYTIVWSELRLLCYDNPLARGEFRRAFPREIQSAPRVDHSALGTDQSAPGTDHSALGTDQSAPGAHKASMKRQEAPTKRLDEPEAVGAMKTRTFQEHEVAEVRSKANRINKLAKPRTLADCELVLKISTLWNDGLLSESCVETVLESYERKHQLGKPVANPMGWLWSTMRGQCQREGVKLERLLATCQFPTQLIPSWAQPCAVEVPT